MNKSFDNYDFLICLFAKVSKKQIFILDGTENLHKVIQKIQNNEQLKELFAEKYQFNQNGYSENLQQDIINMWGLFLSPTDNYCYFLEENSLVNSYNRIVKEHKINKSLINIATSLYFGALKTEHKRFMNSNNIVAKIQRKINKLQEKLKKRN